MSKLITNTIRHTGGSADNITLDNSQNVTIEGNATVDGKAGIGVTSPADNSILHVKSSVAADYRPLVVEGSATNGSGVSIWNSGAQRIFVGSGGDNNVSGSSLTDGLVRAENNLQFAVGNSLKAKIQSDGDVKINDGDLVFGTAGKGICLGVTSNTDSNTLEDYEEGTFTPTLIAGNNGYRFQRGSYVKVGQMVHVTAFIEVSAACSSGNLGISGLPFTSSTVDSNAHQTIMGPCYSNRCSLGNNAVWYLAANSSTAYCYAIDSNASNGTTLLDANNLSQANASAIMLSGTYRTT